MFPVDEKQWDPRGVPMTTPRLLARCSAVVAVFGMGARGQGGDAPAAVGSHPPEGGRRGKLRRDRQSWRFVGDDEANTWLDCQRRDPWQLPAA
jgi:hypothetical protein